MPVIKNSDHKPVRGVFLLQPPFESDQENSEFLSPPKTKKSNRKRLRKKLHSASHIQDSSKATPKQPKSRERLTKAPPAG